MKLALRTRTITFPRRPLLMGIVNINDDSFSGDGTLDPIVAVDQALKMVQQGADIIDFGGESARTNRTAITEQEELRRVLPVLESFQDRCRTISPRDSIQVYPPILSINTWRPAVARETLLAGGEILNDISGLPDATNARICSETHAALLIMHSVGDPKMPHTHVNYENVLKTMDSFFENKMALAIRSGLSFDSIVLDPGIDFAKQQADNLRILAFGKDFNHFQRPVLWPISRKTVIGKTLNIPIPSDRDAGTIACLVAGITRGISIFRVHQVDAAYAANTILHSFLPF